MNKIIRFLAIVLLIPSCNINKHQSDNQPPISFQTNSEGAGQTFEIKFTKGPAFNHPLMAIWIEDTLGNYIQTLYVSQSIAKGTFEHADISTGKWVAGPIRRPATLPYWVHKRNIKADDGYYIPSPSKPIADAYTGATPSGNFSLIAKADKQLSYPVCILFEINQSWDWNEYWTNSKFPDDADYKTSSQPALVYKAMLRNKLQGESELKVIGHSHYSGKDGSLTTDLSTITTALQIAQNITITVK